MAAVEKLEMAERQRSSDDEEAMPVGSPMSKKVSRTGTVFTPTNRPPMKEDPKTTDQLAMEGAADTKLFSALVGVFQLAVLIVYALDLDYSKDFSGGLALYPQFIAVSIMIFFGFGFLMTFLRRYGFSAIGYVLFLSVLTVEWSVPLQNWFEDAAGERSGQHIVGVYELLNGLFCAGAVMISFGVVIGKTTPTQLVVLAIVETVFFWVNVYFGVMKNHAHDVGGGAVIHLFGGVTGIVASRVLNDPKTRGHKDNASCYSSDIFGLAGTLFLWIMWPSFNAAVATPGEPFNRAVINTVLSLIGSTVTTFVYTRFVTEGKFNVVHVQNSTLAGGVMMGVIGDAQIHPATAVFCGMFIGAVSVLGYQYASPFLNNFMGIHDTCGVLNLHLVPGFFACIISMIAASETTLGDGTHDKMVGRQALLLLYTLLWGTVSGLVSGVGMLMVARVKTISQANLFNDRPFWEMPSDYAYVVDEEKSA